jgi:exonuclease VII large subunit
MPTGAERRHRQLDIASQRLAAASAGSFRRAREHNERFRLRVDELDGRRAGPSPSCCSTGCSLASIGQLLEVLQLSWRLALRPGAMEDRPVRSVTAVEAGMALNIEFADGRIRAVAGEAPRPASRPCAQQDPDGQPSLFQG